MNVKDIQTYLLNKNIKAHITGFKLLIRAIELSQNNQYLKFYNLYEDLAKEFNLSKIKVNRDINYAIKSANIKMSNSEFISRSLIDLS